MFKNHGYKVLLIDGDVENPNTYLLLGGKLKNEVAVPFFRPKIIKEECTKCGICAENCTAHALLYVKDSYPIPMLAVCSGCKLCYKICPVNAIEEDYNVIGWTYKTKINKISLMVGELKPSEARSAAIIESLFEDLDYIIKENPNKYDIIILDTAPGAHCDVELLIKRADIVIPVTEPTKFGMMDLIRIIDLITLLGKKYKVIVNRSSLLGFKEEFLKELENKKIDILGDIPLDNEILASYCQGVPIMDEKSKYSINGAGYIAFQQIFENLLKWMDNL